MKSGDAFATSGMIWLRCRPRAKGVRIDRFSGEIDDLFIADPAPRPDEIAQRGQNGGCDLPNHSLFCIDPFTRVYENLRRPRRHVGRRAEGRGFG